ncbi:uncharacterized protein ARMOST_08519 [Armillaria ostoyae]|uniref:Uncharacterized protein n=1 Tax=Armillaria ostoyae TaxID=47428 RepID=A0A284R8U2_ARMOS|nr:uncharacterized protein ARMOST_08519 [Armillaria ostoyae]
MYPQRPGESRQVCLSKHLTYPKYVRNDLILAVGVGVRTSSGSRSCDGAGGAPLRTAAPRDIANVTTARLEALIPLQDLFTIGNATI